MLYIARVGTTPVRGRIRGETAELKLNWTGRPGRTSVGDSSRKERVVLQTTSRDQPRASSHINDNYCVTKLQTRLLAGSSPQTIDICTNLNVKLHVVTCSYCTRAFPKERIKSRVSRLLLQRLQLKVCEKCFLCHSIVLCSPVTNVRNVASNLPVGARLLNFWQTWLDMGASPKVVQILKEGYTLPFRIRPKLTRSPTVISCYVNPHRNSYLLEALHQLIDKMQCN